MNNALNQTQVETLVNSSLNALQLAQNALTQAQNVFSAAGIDMAAHGLNMPQVTTQAAPAANRSNRSTRSGNGNTSAGRQPSAEQVQIRQTIIDWCNSNNAGLFTNKSMVEMLGKDKIQVRNAINALTDQGVVVRWAEKFPAGAPGAREIIYKPANMASPL